MSLLVARGDAASTEGMAHQVCLAQNNDVENNAHETTLDTQVIQQDLSLSSSSSSLDDDENISVIPSSNDAEEAAEVQTDRNGHVTTSSDVANVQQVPEQETVPSEPQGEEPNRQQQEQFRSKRSPCASKWASVVIVCASLLVMCVLVVVVVTVVIVTNNKKQQSTAPPPTTSPPLALDTQYLQQIRTLLVPPSLWTDANAPQMRATEYMAFSEIKIAVDNPTRLKQRYAILTIYFANGGGWPMTHDISKHECDWSMVECNSNGTIVELHLGGSQLDLTGTLPPEIGMFEHLEYLDLEHNRLEGSIPESLYQLTKLVVLKLSTNRFVSTISPQISNFKSLETLYLHDNFFSGEIPATLKELDRLQHVWLMSNRITGPILQYMPFWPDIVHVDYSDTMLSGSFPTEIGLLTNLVKFVALRTRMTGTIPSQLGLLSTNLKLIDMSDSYLHGSIPTTLGTMSALEILVFGQSSLNSTIPTELAQLSNAQSISFHKNQLTGTIPTELGTFRNLKWLWLNYNRLTGTIPSELGNLSKLERCTLYRNRLTGHMPSEICALRNKSLSKLDNSCEDVSCETPECCTRCY